MAPATAFRRSVSFVLVVLVAVGAGALAILLPLRGSWDSWLTADSWFLMVPTWVLSLACAGFFGWLAFAGEEADARRRMRAALRWAGALGVTGFFAGAMVPCLLEWGGNLCWILGPFTVAPLAFGFGLLLGGLAPDRPHRVISTLLGGVLLATLLPLAGMIVRDVALVGSEKAWDRGLRVLVAIGFVLGLLLVGFGPRLLRRRAARTTAPLA